MTPKLFYTIWFSQRNGSSLLCEGLKSTGIAGCPEEFFNRPAGVSLLEHFKVQDYRQFREALWEAGSTPNGVFGIKVNAPRKENDPTIAALKQAAGPNEQLTNAQVWDNLLPNGKHIFITRRNKVRQAVSWWKAIVSQEWHRKANENRPYRPTAISDKYDFSAIRHLLTETTFREAKIQDLLQDAQVTPLTIVYEDFVNNFDATIRQVVDFLGIQADSYTIKPPYYQQLADELSDEWTERFRLDMQKDWDNPVW